MRGIVGTAGHIDHGKTALIEALTGEHTDRLPEEQARGISIDLGFTHLETERGQLGVIDVPGHEGFIRNMLAGATGIDVLLLVVAADEGVMPQTREHVAIAELLGVHQAVVALTKTDLVDDEWLGLVHDDLAGFLAETPFAGAPVVPTSTVDGTGIDAVRDAITDVFAGSRGRSDDLFRMPVDRIFTVRGTGTVVTGTVWSGSLELESTVRLLPGPRPDESLEARVRGLQVHGADVERVEAGQRAAVALAGVDRELVERGMTLVRDPAWKASSMVTASVRVLPGSGWRIEHWQRLRVHVGTAEALARAVLLENETLEPGRQGLLQLRLESPMLVRGGDRLVVRSYSPVTTIGGGVVVEPWAPKRTRLEAGDLERFTALLDDNVRRRVDAHVEAAGAGGVDPAELPIAVGRPPSDVDRAVHEADVVQVGGRVFARGVVERVQRGMVTAVSRHHERAPLQPGMDPARLRRDAAPGAADVLVEQVLAGLIEDDVLAMTRGAVARTDFAPAPTAAQERLANRVQEHLSEAGLAPPRIDALAELTGSTDPLDDVLAWLEATGTLVRIQHDLFMDVRTLQAAVDRLRSQLAGRTGLSPGDFREVLDVSRKHLIPLLEYLDRAGITARDAGGRRLADS